MLGVQVGEAYVVAMLTSNVTVKRPATLAKE